MSLTTILYSRFFGKLVGMDEHGNNYYCSKVRPKFGREKRWVIYKDNVEASLIPPEWHGWLHHTIPAPLSESCVKQSKWQLEHIPNQTGTIEAYRPKNQVLNSENSQRHLNDYEVWNPE